MSMPSSSASVVMTARSSPRISRPSSSRRCCGGVAGAVGRRPARRARGRVCARSSLTSRLSSSTALRDLMKQIVRAPSRTSSREQLGRLAERRAPRAERLVGQRRVPHRDAPRGRRRAVVVDQRDVLEAGQALGQLDRVGDRRRGRAGSAARCRRRRRCGAGGAARWRRASRTRRGRRAPRRPRRRRGSRTGRAQAAWLGRMPTCSMSGLVSTTLALLADLRARLARRVAVVDRRAHALAQAEAGQRARLVLGERLGRVQVQRARARVAAEHVERRQVEAHRLARGGAGRDDRRAARRRRRRPRPGGSRAARRRARRARRARRGAARRAASTSLASPGPFARLAHEPPVGAPGVEQRAPRLGLAVFGHGLR